MQPGSVQRFNCIIDHMMSFRRGEGGGLHNAAFTVCTTCAGFSNEAVCCHKLLGLCDKRGMTS